MENFRAVFMYFFLNTKTHAENVADPSLRNEEEIMLLGSVVRKHGHFCFFIDSK